MLTAMGDIMREAYKRGWITTRDGNISVRKSLDGNISNFVYITPKGVRKTTIHPEHIIKVDIDSTDVGNVSTEYFMHRLLLLDATRTRSVVHLHPTYCVAAMHAGHDLSEITKDFPELKRYTRVGFNVPFVEAGSHELAKFTNAAFRSYYPAKPLTVDIVGQVGHGVTAVGKNPWDAFEHIERLEHICQIVMVSRR